MNISSRAKKEAVTGKKSNTSALELSAGDSTHTCGAHATLFEQGGCS